MKVTPRERQILNFIGSFHRTRGHGPSIREICSGIGLKSPGSLYKIIKRLEEKGLLKTTRGRSRTIRLTGAGRTLLRPHVAAGKRVRKIPLLGRIAAGEPIDADQELLEELGCDPGLFGASECFALLVKGDSLIEKHIRPGDIAVIRPAQEVANGEIGAVIVDGLLPEAVLKIVRYKKDSLELHSANPAYPPLVFRQEEQGRVRIIGRLAGIIRRFQ